MQGRSSNSAGAIYLDRTDRLEALRRAAIVARQRAPAINEIILFGSLASGIPTPRSDADILIIVESSLHENPRDRIPEMLQALSPLPCPVDLFVLTREEFDRYRSEGSPLLRVAAKDGIQLL